MNTPAKVTQYVVGQPKVFEGKRTEHVVSKKYAEKNLSLAMAIDIVLLNGCLMGFMTANMPADPALRLPLSTLILFLLLTNAIWLITTPYSDIYRIFEGFRLDLKIHDLFWASLIYFGVISMVYYQFFFTVFNFHFLVPAFLTFLTLSILARYVIRYYNRNRTVLLTYAVVGGDLAHINYLDKVFSSVYGKYTFCMGRFAPQELTGVERLGDYKDIEYYIKHNKVNKLLYFYSDMSKQEVQRIIKLCRARFIDFEVVPTEFDFFERGIQVEQFARLPIFRRQGEPLYLLKNKILKRAFDLGFSISVILLVFPWLLPIIALLIKLESKGPVFFVQKRTGYWNKSFNCIKFRTMRLNDDCDKLQATKCDDRITRIGAFLRKTNMDELPQFFNVLLGDMSVVGPRPHMLKHTEDYSKLIDEFMIRHEVKPGITGWAQVSGWRGPTEEVYQMAKRVEYDVHYIENWSFWFDCKCIFLTVFNMFRGEENAF